MRVFVSQYCIDVAKRFETRCPIAIALQIKLGNFEKNVCRGGIYVQCDGKCFAGNKFLGSVDQAGFDLIIHFDSDHELFRSTVIPRWVEILR